MTRLVLIAAENLGSASIARPVIECHAEEIAFVMMTPNVATNTSRRRNIALSMVRRASPSFVAFKFAEMYVHNLLAWLRGSSIKQTAKRFGVEVRQYPSASDPSFLRDLRQARPAYALNAGPAILSEEVIGEPEVATLNCHGARLPEYKGAANYVWMLINGESVGYPTIQRMEVEIDAGEPYAECAVEIDPAWSAYRLNHELTSAGGRLYADFVAEALRSGLPTALHRPGAVEAYRGFPTRQDVRELRRRGHRMLTLRDVLQLL